MGTIQEYFNKNEPKERINIFIEGDKIEKTEGNTLMIDDYYQLESVYISDLPNLTKITIRNCKKLESLELYLDKEIEIVLSDGVNLKNIKTNNNQDKPIIVYRNKEKVGFCWNCIFHAISLIGIVSLAVYIVYLKNKEKTTKLQQKLKK
jgi:hypothetical protein